MWNVPKGRSMRILLVIWLTLWAGLALAQGGFVTIGTGSITGVYFPTGGAICRLLNKNRDTHGYRCVVDPTGGSIDNLDALRDGWIDIGVVQADVQYDAVMGVKAFQSEPMPDLRTMFSVHAEAFTLLVRDGSGIESFSDLVGKRVNIGNPGSGNRATMELVMDSFGIANTDFADATEFPGDVMLEAMCNGELDAAVYTIGHPSALIKELTGFCDTSILPVASDEMILMEMEHPFYRGVTIPGGMYASNPDDIATIGVGATVVTMADADEDLIYAVTRAVFDNIVELRSLHPAFANLMAEEMVGEDLTAPLHPGAEKALRELRLFDTSD